jgi:hypothetical protein
MGRKSRSNSFPKVLPQADPGQSLAPMSRRLPAISLMCAWLCASGALLDMAQVFAWTRMFTDYASVEPLSAALSDTFSGRPCEICRAVTSAREAAGQRAPAVLSAGGDRMILIFDRPEVFVAAPSERAWPKVTLVRAVSRICDVPVPPPKAPAA